MRFKHLSERAQLAPSRSQYSNYESYTYAYVSWKTTTPYANYQDVLTSPSRQGTRPATSVFFLGLKKHHSLGRNSGFPSSNPLLPQSTFKVAWYMRNRATSITEFMKANRDSGSRLLLFDETLLKDSQSSPYLNALCPGRLISSWCEIGQRELPMHVVIKPANTIALPDLFSDEYDHLKASRPRGVLGPFHKRFDGSVSEHQTALLLPCRQNANISGYGNPLLPTFKLTLTTILPHVIYTPTADHLITPFLPHNMLPFLFWKSAKPAKITTAAVPGRPLTKPTRQLVILATITLTSIHLSTIASSCSSNSSTVKVDDAKPVRSGPSDINRSNRTPTNYLFNLNNNEDKSAVKVTNHKFLSAAKPPYERHCFVKTPLTTPPVQEYARHLELEEMKDEYGTQLQKMFYEQVKKKIKKELGGRGNKDKTRKATGIPDTEYMDVFDGAAARSPISPSAADSVVTVSRPKRLPPAPPTADYNCTTGSPLR
ncbi:uncharacterized protein BDR25DRAFT_349573 [Lindgomyces ingoldianus]|uniref:Uncharacterized protein n=1 Tax=Lindgomyces ingoldianus TaxID=673940 RepID=A0ACB6RBG6_9PLEO|nr:uncharacterized protein BDR25DRAFT_349573 [Lindgomyces ingoldianus]KAF2476486.1 hypothetical protein BDR25DRAFT_349573 [Lindgomyces ingoldianus]